MRKAIPKSLRFEVFKRDSFTCQYCGAKAPDVLLHIDHIKPVADGGENDIINLVTACVGCNLGKSDKALSDHSTLEKQRDQLQELAERRQQLEMMVEWRESLRNLDTDYVKAIQDEFLKHSDFYANETGERDIRKWLKKYTIAEIFAAIETSCVQYLKEAEGKITSESWNRAFDMVPRIIEMNRRGGLTENMKAIFYARGILRRRLRYVDERDVISLMKAAISSGLDPQELIHIAKYCRNWTDFQDEIYAFIGGSEE
ncbi:MAG TPA: HNH endonuclease [Bryobacteraceae bacterium]|nr:HNH endonuclease [Bryobacteraceae bacterium]